jgi:Ni,Fe-hydrogenase maturation factor
VYGIEGKQFDPGTGLSREVKQAVENVAQQIAAESIRSAFCLYPRP